MSAVLVADSIGKWFSRRPVLMAATLRAFTGRIGYLVGRNGCGKSTLLRIMAGELAADHGVVTYRGVARMPPRWHLLAREGFCYLPDRDLLAPDWTPRRHLATIARQFGLPGYEEAAEECAIASFMDRPCEALSTGERRRVEVATALARRPDCLLADEPYRNLDPADRAVIARALRALAASGCAVVVTGHEIEDLFGSADYLVWCTDRTTYELGSPQAALADWRFVKEYLGPARAAQLKMDMLLPPAVGD
jgi:lipopolysaccharide export system ATP-binding protein